MKIVVQASLPASFGGKMPPLLSIFLASSSLGVK